MELVYPHCSPSSRSRSYLPGVTRLLTSVSYTTSPSSNMSSLPTSHAREARCRRKLGWPGSWSLGALFVGPSPVVGGVGCALGGVGCGLTATASGRSRGSSAILLVVVKESPLVGCGLHSCTSLPQRGMSRKRSRKRPVAGGRTSGSDSGVHRRRGRPWVELSAK